MGIHAIAGYVPAEVEDFRRRLFDLGLPSDVTDTIIQTVMDNLPDSFESSAATTVPLATIARSFYKSSLLRTEQLGHNLVADVAWNMLLDLFAASEEGRSVSVTSLCIASGGPPTTALRHLKAMEEQGLIRRTEDRKDRRRTWIEPTEHTKTVMRDLILKFYVPIQLPPRR